MIKKYLFDIIKKEDYEKHYHVTIHSWIMTDEWEKLLERYKELNKEDFFIAWLGDGRYVMFSCKLFANPHGCGFRDDWPHGEWLNFKQQVYNRNKIYDENMKEA